MSVAAVLVALAASQAASPRGDGQPAIPRVDAQGISQDDRVLREAPAPQESAPDSRAGIPYLPQSAGRRRQSPTLELGAMALARTRTFTTPEGRTDAWVDVELTPGLALNAEVGAWTFAVGYAPRLTLPSVSQGSPLLVLNVGSLLVQWKPAPIWTLAAQGSLAYGDFNQLVPVTAPGTPSGGGGQAAPPMPVTSLLSFLYIDLRAALRATVQPSVRTAFQLSAGFTDTGGLDSVGEAAQPRIRGPQAGAAFDWDASASSRLTTSVSGQIVRFVDGFQFPLGTLTETLRMRPLGSTELSFTAGAAVAGSEPNTRWAAGHVLPVASASISYVVERGEFRPLQLAFMLGLGPFVDPWLRVAYERATASASVEWRPGLEWVLGGTLAAAHTPFDDRPPETYGNAGASLGFVPWPFLQFTLAAFTIRQVVGPLADSQDFRQFTILLSATLREVVSL